MAATLLSKSSLSLWTARDLERLNTGNERYELIRGELIEMSPPPGYEHGIKTLSLSARLAIFVEDCQLGVSFASETGFIVEQNPDSVMAPDWAFISSERVPNPAPKGYTTVVPDIVLEVRSPSDTRLEVGRKVDMWLLAGVKIVWELNMKTRILTVHRTGESPRFLSKNDNLTGEEILPGFSLSLDALLRE